MREVLLPTEEQLDDARRVIAQYLPMTPTATLSIRGHRVWAKLESLQTTGSFKVRGGLAAVHAARADDPTGAVITASAGNHGLGVAHAANLLGVRATVVVPANASSAKVKKLRGYDIELIQIGSSYDDAQTHAMMLAEERAIRYVSPFNDTHVIAGQATVFEEMMYQAPEIEHLVVPVGGGGLLSGAIMAREAHAHHDIHIVGVQPEESAAMYHVLRGVAMEDVRHRPTIADGLAGGGDNGAATNELIAQHNIDIVLVPELSIRRGVREAAETSGLVLEGSAATPYAAIATGLVEPTSPHVGFIASGRNISHDLFLTLLGEPLEN